MYQKQTATKEIDLAMKVLDDSKDGKIGFAEFFAWTKWFKD